MGSRSFNLNVAAGCFYMQLTPAWYPLREHATQSQLFYCDKRFICVHSGRRSGKTEIAKRKLVFSLIQDRGHHLTHRYAYLAPTRPQGKRIAWQHLKDLTPKDWLSRPPDESNLVIHTRFNSELHVIGMDNPARFEGDGWDGCVEDEAADQKQNINRSVRPALADRNGWWWKIGVAKRQGSNAVQYREQCERGYKEAADPESLYATFSWPSWDILPAGEVEQLRHDMDLKDFNEQIGGEWTAIGGQAFHAFDENIHVKSISYDHTKPIIVGSDFNVSPMAWVIGHSDGKTLEVFDEIWLNDTNTSRTLDILWDRYGTHKGGWLFYGDATGQARRTSASESDYAQIVNDKRFNARALYPKGNPPIKDRLSSCNALLRNASGDVRFHCDTRCIHLIADLKNRGLTSDGYPIDSKSKVAGNIGHITDALGYVIHSRWPVRILSKGTGTFSVYSGE